MEIGIVDVFLEWDQNFWVLVRRFVKVSRECDRGFLGVGKRPDY